MGNRGRIHKKDRTLRESRFAHNHWICCALDFRGRHRDVWGDSYTELFFLDEPTAFAAGHRPCFECRRKDAELFAQLAGGLRAWQMDKLLHAQRLDGKAKRNHLLAIATLPDGAFIALDGEPYAVRGARLLRWTPSGYDGSRRRPRAGKVDVLTPPLTLKVLRNGYQPL